MVVADDPVKAAFHEVCYGLSKGWPKEILLGCTTATRRTAGGPACSIFPLKRSNPKWGFMTGRAPMANLSGIRQSKQLPASSSSWCPHGLGIRSS